MEHRLGRSKQVSGHQTNQNDHDNCRNDHTPTLFHTRIVITRDAIESSIEALQKPVTFTVVNGRRRVELARNENPDPMLCDVMMSELDGYGVLRAVQQDAKLALIAFIFLAAKGEKDDLRSGMNLRADD